MSSESFPKENRLLKTVDFNYLRLKSKKFVQNPIIIYLKPTRKNSDLSRIGISANKKFGNACKRNMFKRTIRETFRKSDVKSTGYDLLIVANNKFFNKNDKLFKDDLIKIVNSFDKILNKLKVMEI
jgi:ribonuclease P protein component